MGVNVSVRVFRQFVGHEMQDVQVVGCLAHALLRGVAARLQMPVAEEQFVKVFPGFHPGLVLRVFFQKVGTGG